MPYIVTTKRQVQPWPAHMAKPAPMRVSRRAVATLEEAHEAVDPLPDAGVIEVEQVDLRELRKRAGLDYSATRATMTGADILDAYNARQACDDAGCER